MTKITFTFCFFLLFCGVKAQIKFNAPQQKGEMEFINLDNIKFKEYYQSQHPTGQVFEMRRLERNDLFDIYELSLDNMPCLVPNELVKAHIRNSFLPSIQQDNSARIPNPFRKGFPF